jgi:hypothetical protein
MKFNQKMNVKHPLIAVFILINTLAFSQSNVENDSVKLDTKTIYSLCLDGDVKAAFPLLEIDKNKKISNGDLALKTEFNRRFKGEKDSSDYLKNKKSAIDPLLKIYHNYWRISVLDKNKNNDTLLTNEVFNFLKNNYLPAKNLVFNDDSIDVYLIKYIEQLGLHTTGFGKTGRLIDLLVWKTEKDTTYNFALNSEKTSANVVFMDDFITLGWEEYTTLDKYYPAGWATKKALYCVRKAYDLNSEDFLISYLGHESRHFADYKLFPNLKSADLEYRAKLVELAMAKTTLFELIEFFITNANYDSDNGHSIANYCAIRDISKVLFKKDFEKDINKWKALSIKKINKAAYKALTVNTEALKKTPNIETFIK